MEYCWEFQNKPLYLSATDFWQKSQEHSVEERAVFLTNSSGTRTIYMQTKKVRIQLQTIKKLIQNGL